MAEIPILINNPNKHFFWPNFCLFIFVFHFVYLDLVRDMANTQFYNPTFLIQILDVFKTFKNGFLHTIKYVRNITTPPHTSLFSQSLSRSI